MPLLQRYILFQLLRVFCGVLTVLTVLLVVGGVFQEVSQSGLGVFQTLQILPYIIPSLLPFSIPVAVLLTVCIVYGRMSANREIIVTKAAGIHVTTILWPALFLGGMLSVGSLLLTDQAIPWSVGNIRRVVAQAMEDIVLDVLRTHHELTLPQGGMSISVRGVRGRTLLQPIVRYTAAGGTTVTAQANQATLAFQLDQGRLLLALKDCHLDVPGRGSFWLSEVTRGLPLPGSYNSTKPRHMSLDTLQDELQILEEQEIQLDSQRALVSAMALTTGNFQRLRGHSLKKLKRQEENVRIGHARLRTEWHSRIAFSSSCFFFALVGAPFSILQARRQVLTNFLACFLPITLLYYPVVMLCMNQSKTGAIDPSWSMWIGNGLLLLVGLAVFHRCRRH